jgi:hypothetical protein
MCHNISRIQRTDRFGRTPLSPLLHPCLTTSHPHPHTHTNNQTNKQPPIIQVSYPAVSLSALQYVSSTKYAYTAILLHFFKGNPKTATPFGTVEEVMGAMEMTNPGTIWANVLAMLAIYMLFNVGGFFCLKHLYKEQR